ncbi:TrkH family potassium uptake protein [Testudinibacter aquarius]|uniref:Trk system potassium uptake protein n=2 Tax=Testudinibacter aquarius TaxID=1524974 RepID=A0A4R3YAM5_9PAST|nr:TrkH family potassium uptake protein [Testudinibacter aquarius]TCV89455.1 trk system potassium uptake protein TrkH [Testudinibacter aquarius]
MANLSQSINFMMFNSAFILYTLGSVLNKIAYLLLLPIITALVTNGDGLAEFSQSFVIILFFSFLLTWKKPINMALRVKDMLLMTTLIWVVVGLFSALPFIFIKHISLTDAYFETMSGLTTTGSSVLSNLNNTAPSLLMWRSTLQWIGGLGMIVMAVAILPFLNVGGMTLFRSESSDWSEKSTPHTKDIAKNIIRIYILLTVLSIVAFMLSGMSFFDAINHSFAALSTGGFSTRDAGLADYSNAAQWVCALFMFLGSLPFLLFLQAAQKRNFKIIAYNQQIVGFTLFIVVTGLFLTGYLYQQHIFNFNDSLRFSFFSLINILSTSGFTLVNFDTWTSATTIIFAFAFLIGGCSGSTAGGIKIFRFQIIFSLLKIQIQTLVHPNSVHLLQYNGKKVQNNTLFAIITFIFCYFISIFILSVLLAISGMDSLEALSSAATAIGNVGPGLGPSVGPSGNFANIPEIAKWLMSIGMLLGRLEITTMLVLLFPRYWKM